VAARHIAGKQFWEFESMQAFLYLYYKFIINKKYLAPLKRRHATALMRTTQTHGAEYLYTCHTLNY